MTKELENKLNNIRIPMVKNKQDMANLNLTLKEINAIVIGLKLTNAYEDILDEELKLKHED